MAHEGERVVPSYINEKLFGIKNKDLPKLVALGLGKVAPPKINYEDLKQAIAINNVYKISNTETAKELRDVKNLLTQYLNNQTSTFVNASADPNQLIKIQIEHQKKQILKSNA
jgi:hypothetical protein